MEYGRIVTSTDSSPYWLCIHVWPDSRQLLQTSHPQLRSITYVYSGCLSPGQSYVLPDSSLVCTVEITLLATPSYQCLLKPKNKR